MPRTWHTGNKPVPDDQLIDHFWSKVNKCGPVPGHRPELGACWIWTDSDNGHGYGRFSIRRKTVYAHRFAFELTYGPLSPGEQARHKCDNGAGGCVRPYHMERGTAADNARDAIERGRYTREICRRGHIYAEVGVRVASPDAKHPGKRSCKACITEADRRRHMNPVVCIACGQTKPHAGRQLCKTCHTRSRQSRRPTDDRGLV